MNRPLTSLIITSRVGFLLENPVNRDPGRVDWVIKDIARQQCDFLLTCISNPAVRQYRVRSDQVIKGFLLEEGFTPNPEWQYGYPLDFTWYDEEQNILYERCALPRPSFVRGDVETLNKCRDFEPLSDALSLEEYLEKHYGNYSRKETAPEYKPTEHAFVLR